MSDIEAVLAGICAGLFFIVGLATFAALNAALNIGTKYWNPRVPAFSDDWARRVDFQCPGCGGRVPGYVCSQLYLTCMACETRLHPARTPQHPDKLTAEG